MLKPLFQLPPLFTLIKRLFTFSTFFRVVSEIVDISPQQSEIRECHSRKLLWVFLNDFIYSLMYITVNIHLFNILPVMPNFHTFKSFILNVRYIANVKHLLHLSSLVTLEEMGISCGCGAIWIWHKEKKNFMNTYGTELCLLSIFKRIEKSVQAI